MTTEAPLPSPVPLDKSHDLSAFDCGGEHQAASE
jgi:hypothetical protein